MPTLPNTLFALNSVFGDEFSDNYIESLIELSGNMITPETVHARYVRRMVELGWKFGHWYSTELKTSRQLCAYDQLTENKKLLLDCMVVVCNCREP